ncbi:ATP-binding protein [Flavobacterium qiangtangense]|uniref:histidine kinase n=1 Tax=Flavobacterium qiangtangense TaxID=1442595 RepID=A0ABW1PME7_9FLAO
MSEFQKTTRPVISVANIIAVAHEAMIVIDAENKISNANGSFLTKFNLSEEEIIEKHLFEINYKSFHISEIENAFLVLLSENGLVQNLEFTQNFPLLGEKTFLLNIQNSSDGSNNFKILAFKEKDKNSEQHQQLCQTQSFLSSVLNSTNYGIASYEAVRNDAGKLIDFKISYTNIEVPRNFGLDPKDVIGKKCSEVYPGIFDNGIFEKMANCMETGIPEKYEILATHEGREMWLSASIEKVNNSVAVTSKNITAEKQAALEIEAMNAELEKQNVELASFAYVSSHDLQEPLRKIQLFTSRILERERENFSDSSVGYFKSITNAANRMQNLIESLLNYSSMDASEIKFIPLDLNKAVDEIKSNMLELIEKRNARIEVEDLPTLAVIPVQFQQLLSNLISNGIKYGKPGIKPHIKINAEIISLEEFAGKNFWKINVADNGIGFEQEYEHKIFELFKRLHGKTDYEGTGIGLAICKKIAQKHGGFIRAIGNPGIGATFSVFVPIK